MAEDSEEFGFEEEEFKGGEEEGPIRVKLPRGNEVLGVVQQRLGGGRMRVACLDGNSRVCTVPGRLKKSLWVRENDILIIKPWVFGGDKKGEVLYKYRKSQVDWLRRNGYLDKLSKIKEF